MAELKTDKKKEEYNMVAFRCPYCSEMNMKDWESIKANDIWECPFCKSTFKMK